MTATPAGWLNEPGRLAQLRAVAALVHAAPYMMRGQRSDWLEELSGDCTGKSQAARMMFYEMGWPQNAMEFWACDLPDGKRHAVLIINIADVDGTVIPTVIDCRYQVPMRKDDLPYQDWSRVE